MNLKKMYETIGSDYQIVLERFCGHDEMLAKFVKVFVGDDTFQHLADAAGKLDYPEIESRAHALKGVAGNLGFERLHVACGELVSSVRFDRLDEVPENFRKVEKEHGTVCDTIKNLMENDTGQ